MLQFLLPIAALLAGSVLTVVLLALPELRGDAMDAARMPSNEGAMR